MAQSQLTHLDAEAIGDDVATSHDFTFGHDRPLIDTSIQVGALVLLQIVDIDVGADLGQSFRIIFIGLDDDTIGIDRHHSTVALRHNCGPGVPGYRQLKSGPDKRRASLE